MHEHTFLKGLMKRVESVVAGAGARRAVGVTVRLGALSHITADHFREHFVEAAAGTIADGAALTVVELTDAGDPLAQEIVLESVEVEE
jgi:hydrogenase nickel incorporation protein HypA/HybF